jgi:hypothetical protein
LADSDISSRSCELDLAPTTGQTTAQWCSCHQGLSNSSNPASGTELQVGSSRDA